MRAGSRTATALSLALTTALALPSVHWCAISWQQVKLECLARCSPAPGPECEAPCARAHASAQDDPASECAGSDRCPAAPKRPARADSPRPAGHGRAYLVNDFPHGVVRKLGHALVASWLSIAPVAFTVIEPPERHSARSSEPEIRPPTLDRATVRLARAPPVNA
jgi:hypothetical protein